MKQEEKLEEAKRLYQTANADQRYVLESLFPELKESEDERIRKEILEFVTIVADSKSNKMEWITWLEKQGEQKVPINDFKAKDWYVSKVDGKIHNIYNSGVEPKFKAGKNWSEEDECYMGECISAIATKDGWSFEEKRKTKHWLQYLKQRIGG